MTKLFYKDIKTREIVSYEQLLIDIHNTPNISLYLKSNSNYEIFKNIIISLIIGHEITILDSDFTDSEIIKLLGKTDVLNTIIPVNIPSNITLDNLLIKITSNTNNWKINLFTSGTTGLPKQVSHSYESIFRQARQGDKYKNNVWGYAYNPTHMAGLQVFFQCIINLNPIIRLFGLSKEEIYSEILNNGITHLSATPTFYRLLLPPISVCKTIVRITSGGEKFDEKTLDDLKFAFPNAKLTNIYASTEAGTLFASKDNIFTIKDDFIKLKVRVVEKELYIHETLIGKSDSLKTIDGWYPTGDLIEVINNDPLEFKFISRKNQVINVGGYKVNPEEVEEAIRSCKGIHNVIVYGKENKLIGNIICCEVVRIDNSLTESSIRNFLSDKLQEFKIPRIIKFVEKLQTTRTGKISRKA